MNPAEVATALVIERALSKSPAYRKIDDRLYTVKQGSAFVLINVVGCGDNKAQVRCMSQLVKGVELEKDLAIQLLELNAYLRFGAFAYDPHGKLVIFLHSILGGDTLDPEELLATVRDVALIADEYDDKVAKKCGGQTMGDLIEEAAVQRILDSDPDAFNFGREN